MFVEVLFVFLLDLAFTGLFVCSKSDPRVMWTSFSLCLDGELCSQFLMIWCVIVCVNTPFG